MKQSAVLKLNLGGDEMGKRNDVMTEREKKVDFASLSL